MMKMVAASLIVLAASGPVWGADAIDRHARAVPRDGVLDPTGPGWSRDAIENRTVLPCDGVRRGQACPFRFSGAAQF